MAENLEKLARKLIISFPSNIHSLNELKEDLFGYLEKNLNCGINYSYVCQGTLERNLTKKGEQYKDEHLVEMLGTIYRTKEKIHIFAI